MTLAFLFFKTSKLKSSIDEPIAKSFEPFGNDPSLYNIALDLSFASLRHMILAYLTIGLVVEYCSGWDVSLFQYLLLLLLLAVVEAAADEDIVFKTFRLEREFMEADKVKDEIELKSVFVVVMRRRKVNVLL